MKLSKDTKAVSSDLMAGVGFIGCCAAMKMRFTPC